MLRHSAHAVGIKFPMNNKQEYDVYAQNEDVISDGNKVYSEFIY